MGRASTWATWAYRASRRLLTGFPVSNPPEAHVAWLHEQIRSYATPQPYAAPLTTSEENLTGETWEHRLAYRKMLFKEPSVKAAMLTKCMAVAQLDLQIQPRKKSDKRDREIASYVKHAIATSDGGAPKLIMNMLIHAGMDGFSLNEKVLDTFDTDDEYKGFWTLKKVKAKDTRFVRFRLDEYKNVTAVQNMTASQGGAPFDPEDFLIFTHLQIFENPFGISDLRAVNRAANLIESAIKLRAILLENFSGPFLKATATDTGARSQILQVLQMARARGYIVMPENSTLEVINLATSAPDQFQTTIEDLRQEIVTGIQGAYLQLLEGGVPGGRGNTEVHKSVAELFQWWLAAQCANVIQRHLFPDLVVPNYGNSVGLPTCTLGGVNVAAILQELARFKAGQDLGLDLSKKQVSEVGGFESPEDESDRLRPPNAQQQQPPGGGIDLGGLFGGGGSDGNPPAVPPSPPPDRGDGTGNVAGFSDPSAVDTDPVRKFDANPPGPPPRPGLVWKPETHRWIHPQTGEEVPHPETSGEEHLAKLLSEIPDSATREKAKGLFGRIGARVEKFLVKHAVAVSRIGGGLKVLDALLTTPEDVVGKPWLAGKFGANTQHTGDAFEAATGLGGDIAAKVVATVLVKAWAGIKKRLAGKKQMADDATAPELTPAQFVAALLNEIRDECGVPPLSPEELAALEADVAAHVGGEPVRKFAGGPPGPPPRPGLQWKPETHRWVHEAILSHPELAPLAENKKVLGLFGGKLAGIAGGNVYIKGKHDTVATDIAKAVGHDGKPKPVKAEEMDALKSQGWTVAYRAVPEAAHHEGFRTGDLWSGTGLHGSGTYAAYAVPGSPIPDEAAAKSHVGQYGKHIARMAIAPDAKVVTEDQIEAEKVHDLRALDGAISSGAVSIKQAKNIRAILEDNGRYATLKGYDAITKPEKGYVVILNRGKVAIQETNE